MKIKRIGSPFMMMVSLVLALSVNRLQAADKVARIGYQKSGALLLVKNEGSLEKKLAPLGYGVEWREFSSGVPILEALNAGALDVGHSGDAPVVFAQASGVPFVYIGVTAASPENTGIVVPKNSPLKTLADLRGKKVAFTKGSSAHYLVARALQSAGLTFADITPVYLQPPDARAALQSGTIDAWGIWDPFFAAAEVDAQAHALTEGAKLSPHREFYFSRRDFAQNNPAFVTTLLEILQDSGKRALADPKGTAAFLAPKLGIGLPVMERAEARKESYGAIPMDAPALADQQQVADTFFKLGLLPKAVQVGDYVYHPTK